MNIVELSELSSAQLLDLPIDAPIEDFGKEHWKALWLHIAEDWFTDGEYFIDILKEGFPGFNQRSNFHIYCDLRLYMDDQYTWDELAKKNHELGKFS